jgi:hypothetical protein
MEMPLKSAFNDASSHEPEFQQHQARCFEYACGSFHRVARAVNPRQYVGTDWNASLSKVIDNALVGVFVVARRFFDSKRYVC